MWKDDEEYGPMIARLGPRLRELRRRAGLTQAELARRIGLRSGNARWMVRIENGRTGNPGLATVGRYLRACRAGFVDVLDVLDGYTRQAPVPEARAARAIAELEQRLVGVARIRPGAITTDEHRSTQMGRPGAEFTTKTQRHKEDGPAKAPFSRGRVRRGDGWR